MFFEEHGMLNSGHGMLCFFVRFDMPCLERDISCSELDMECSMDGKITTCHVVECTCHADHRQHGLFTGKHGMSFRPS